MDQKLENWLKKNGIEFKLHTHPAVFTVAEAQKHCSFIPGQHCKNLLLRDKKKESFYLVTLPNTKRLDFSKLKTIVNKNKIEFASETDLNNFLGLSKGAVSPLGLVNDEENRILYIIDTSVWNAEIVSFHPNVNTETLELHNETFQKFVKLVGNKFLIEKL